jgi:peptidoglycan-N-acetylglucosamine deacetylase
MIPRISGSILLSLLLVDALPAAGEAASAPAPPQQRTIALTFDDLPLAPRADDLAVVQRVNEALLRVLAGRKVPAIGFVNEGKLQVPGERDARVAVLERWLDAGQALGNHTYSHRSLRDTPLQTYQDDVLHGEVITRQLLARRGGEPALYFRHPFTATGPTPEVKAAFEAFLHARGYVIAPFTVENADYIFQALYADARRRGDGAGAARVRTAYLDHTAAVLKFCEGLSRETFGREIPQILLLHDNEINADSLAELLDRLAARGYGFVSLDAALRDEAYRTPDRFVGTFGPSWLHRWRVALELPARVRDEPDPPKWVLDGYQALTSHRPGFEVSAASTGSEVPATSDSRFRGNDPAGRAGHRPSRSSSRSSARTRLMDGTPGTGGGGPREMRSRRAGRILPAAWSRSSASSQTPTASLM